MIPGPWGKRLHQGGFLLLGGTYALQLFLKSLYHPLPASWFFGLSVLGVFAILGGTSLP